MPAPRSRCSTELCTPSTPVTRSSKESSASSADTISEAATGEIGDQLRDELLRELPRLRRLPSHLERIASLAARGDLRTRVSLFSSVEDARVVTTLANRMILAFAGSLLVVGSAISLALTSAAPNSSSTSVADVFGVLGASIGIVLVLRVVAAVVRDGYQ